MAGRPPKQSPDISIFMSRTAWTIGTSLAFVQAPDLADGLIDLGSRYLFSQLTHRKDEIMAEQVFLLEAVRDPVLKVLAQNYRGAWVAGLETFLLRIGSHSPDSDAALLISTVMGLGYDGLLYSETFFSTRRPM